MSVVLKLQRQQAKALTCPADELLYGGAAGGGKSHLLRAAAIRYAQAINGVQIYLFRRSYGELKLNHMEGPTSFPELLAPLVNAGKVTIVENEIRFHDTGSKIHLCHLQYAKTLRKYQGAEIHILLIDELTHFTEDEYRYLRGRVRLGGLKVPDEFKEELPRIIAGTNPGSIGHVWVKRTFVSQGPMRIVRQDKAEGGMRRVYIPARLEDNPAMLENDPDYADRLEALGDPVLVRAMKEGDWDIVAGSMYGEVWRRHLHEMAPFPIPAHWKMFAGADDGFAAPAAYYWIAEDPEIKTLYVVAELYRARMLPEEFAERVKNIEARIPRIERDQVMRHAALMTRVPCTMDLAAFSNTGQSTTPRGNQLKALGLPVSPSPKWAGSRVHRVQNLHRLLAPNRLDPKGMPGIRFFSTCRHAIETIPVLPRDKDDIEDVDTDADDHAFDAITYGTMRVDRSVRRVRVKGI